MMKPMLLTILATATANLAFAQAVTVRGRVVSETGEPLRNASVSQQLTAVRTDSEGRFVINLAQPGGSLTVVKGGFVRQIFPASAGDMLVTMARGGLLAVSVIDASGNPASRAAITVTCTRSSWTGMATDDRGQRRFGGLAPGRCDVSTSVPDQPSRPTGPPTGPPSLEELNSRMEASRARASQQRAEHLAKAIGVEIRAGEETSIVLVGTPSTATTPMRGNSTISGTIVDEFGDPAEEAVVQVQPVTAGSPPPSAQPRRTGAGLMLNGMIATTDDRGEYRVFGLPPGSYRITAGWSRENPALVFYPGRRDESEATLVTVVADAETANIDLRLTPGLSGTVNGQVLTSAGQRPAAAIAQLVAPATKDSAPQQTALVHANQQGQFTFSGVAPGTYDLQVSAGASYVFATQRRNTVVAAPVIPPMEFASTRVTVADGSPATVSLRTGPGASLRGRIDIEGDRGTLRFQDIRLGAVGDSTRTAEIAGDGTFELRNLYGETRLAVFLPAASGWWLKSFMVGGVNAADDPVAFLNATDSRADARVVLARAALVSGAVTNAGASARVVAFPVDPERRYSGSRYVRTTTMSRDGRYSLEVPPGQYWVVAVESGTLLTEALMMRLQSLSTQVTASDTRAAQVDLSMARLPQ